MKPFIKLTFGVIAILSLTAMNGAIAKGTKGTFWDTKGEINLTLSKGPKKQKVQMGVRENEGFCYLTRVQLMDNQSQAEVYLEKGQWTFVLKTDGDQDKQAAAADCVIFKKRKR